MLALDGLAGTCERHGWRLQLDGRYTGGPLQQGFVVDRLEVWSHMREPLASVPCDIEAVDVAVGLVSRSLAADGLLA